MPAQWTTWEKALWGLSKAVGNDPKERKWVTLLGMKNIYVSTTLGRDLVINMSPKFLALADNIERIFYFEEAPNDFIDVFKRIQKWYGICDLPIAYFTHL